VDYKALVGDASDGYPGVAGVGPKTASSLLAKYGTFENLYKHLGELPERLGLKLATDAEQAALAKRLATIVVDAPVTVDFEKCGVGEWKLADWVGVFEEQGFRSLAGRAKGFFGYYGKKMEKKEEQLGLL
jgi:DNA polymerase-1